MCGERRAHYALRCRCAARVRRAAPSQERVGRRPSRRLRLLLVACREQLRLSDIGGHIPLVARREGALVARALQFLDLWPRFVERRLDRRLWLPLAQQHRPLSRIQVAGGGVLLLVLLVGERRKIGVDAARSRPSATASPSGTPPPPSSCLSNSYTLACSSKETLLFFEDTPIFFKSHRMKPLRFGCGIIEAEVGAAQARRAAQRAQPRRRCCRRASPLETRERCPQLADLWRLQIK